MHRFLVISQLTEAKNSCANAILGWPAFSTHNTSVRSAWADKGTYEVKVINGPTVDDLCGYSQYSQKPTDTTTIMNDVAFHCDSGFDGLLFAIRHDSRIQDQDWFNINHAFDVLGSNNIDSYGICVFVGGEDFDEKHRISFESFCGNAQGRLKSLLNKFSGRAVLFDTITKDSRQQSEQVQRLMECMSYFDKRVSRVKQIQISSKSEKKKKERLKKYAYQNEDIRRYCGLLCQALYQTSHALTKTTFFNVNKRATDLLKALNQLESEKSQTMRTLIDGVTEVVVNLKEIKKDIDSHNIFQMTASDPRVSRIQERIDGMRGHFMTPLNMLEKDVKSSVEKISKRGFLGR